MPDVFAELDDLSKQADADLAAVASADALEQYRIKYLGAKGLLKAKMSLIGQAAADQKKAVGQRLNEIKQQITGAFEAKQGSLADQVGEEGTDVTEPGVRPAVGNKHILMKVIGELTDLFGRMGFSVAAGPEVEDEFHNFIALNIPESHPARDPLDNFYLEGAADKGPGQRLLRTQTSTVQIRVMERQKPPIRVVIPGRVYRPDTVDATHLFMFHQLEALVVDKNVTMVDLKSTVMQFVKAY
ncbi:MAG: Phenylalanyl-tRNA synthetase alpha chain, partial [uncultured Phycisphaerae bacterium]